MDIKEHTGEVNTNTNINTDSGFKWYVIRVVSGKEKKVKELIEQEVKNLKLEKNINQVLTPTEKVFFLKDGKKISKEKNFFPGYIMLECKMDAEIPHILKNIQNVMGFLKTGKDPKDPPIPVRLAEINRILGKVDESEEKAEYYTQSFKLDDTVKVIDGPFNGFTGKIEDVNDERKKVKVMVQIFGRKTPLELGFLQVEKI